MLHEKVTLGGLAERLGQYGGMKRESQWEVQYVGYTVLN